MSRSMKFFLLVAATGMLLASQWGGATDRANHRKYDPNDPVLMCQKDCKSEKSNESYEACMLKCKETHKNQIPAAPYPKK